MAGLRTESGLAGSDIKLATVKFQVVQTGASQLILHDRGATVDCFVLAGHPENLTVLDGEFADGVFLGADVRPPVPGDVNRDTVIDLADVIIALKVIAGMNPSNAHPNADINGDYKINLAEVLYILHKISGFR